MPKKQLDLIFPQNLIKEPVIYRMVQDFDVIFNIRRAKVTDKIGEMVLELDGDESALSGAILWLKDQGIRVSPVTHDAVEG